MSVITECRPGDLVVIIEGGVACQYGEEFDWEKSHEFKIGDMVKYLDEYEEKMESNHHLSWRVLVETKDNKIYSINQLNLVTLEHWKQIESFFGQRFSNKE